VVKAQAMTTHEHVMVEHTSSRSSTLLVLAFFALAVVTLGTFRVLHTDILSLETLSRVSTTLRNASTRATAVTIATSSHTPPRPSFAVCVVGQVRAMARRDVREHARAVLTTPLIEDGGDVEVFLHLDTKGMDEMMEKNASRILVSDVARGVRRGESWKRRTRGVFERGLAADISTTRVRERRSSTRTRAK
jgi:hypothetical protein